MYPRFYLTWVLMTCIYFVRSLSVCVYVRERGREGGRQSVLYHNLMFGKMAPSPLLTVSFRPLRNFRLYLSPQAASLGM